MIDSFSDAVERILLQTDCLAQVRPDPVPHISAMLRVAEMTNSDLAGEFEIVAEDQAAVVRGALFYYLDDMRRARGEFQSVPGDLAQYWTGMAYRRDGDMELARNCFRRAGEQPFYGSALAGAANLNSDLGRQLTWDPFLFTTLVESFYFGEEAGARSLVDVMRVEFEVAFEYSWRQFCRKA